MENFQGAEPMENFQGSQQQMPVRLMLAEALPQAQFGSVELPTVGSLGHHIGTCKPWHFSIQRAAVMGLNVPSATYVHQMKSAKGRKRSRQHSVTCTVKESRCDYEKGKECPKSGMECLSSSPTSAWDIMHVVQIRARP